MADAETVAQQQLDLGRVLELADLMLKSAKERQWEMVTELQAVRDRLIRELFAENRLLEDRCIEEGIHHIIESDKQLAKLIGEERRSLQAEIQKMKQGKNAVKAYSIE